MISVRVCCFPEARNSNIPGARGVFFEFARFFVVGILISCDFLVGNSNIPGARGNF